MCIICVPLFGLSTVLTFSIGWLDIDPFFLWLVKRYWLYVHFWLRLLLCLTDASFYKYITALPLTVLAVMTFFFELFDFGIEAPGTPQNAPLGLAAGFDEPRNFSIFLDFTFIRLKSKNIHNLPSVGNSCCLGAGPLFLCLPCLLRLSSSISSSDFSLKTSGGALQPKSSVL